MGTDGCGFASIGVDKFAREEKIGSITLFAFNEGVMSVRRLTVIVQFIHSFSSSHLLQFECILRVVITTIIAV